MTARYKGLPRITGRPPGWSDEETDNIEGYRRLARALLLSGYFGAVEGDRLDLQWIHGEQARMLADLVDLPNWPPRPDQFYTPYELQQHANRLGQAAKVSMRKLAPKSKTPAKERREKALAQQAELFADAQRVSQSITWADLWATAFSTSGPVRYVMETG